MQIENIVVVVVAANINKGKNMQLTAFIAW